MKANQEIKITANIHAIFSPPVVLLELAIIHSGNNQMIPIIKAKSINPEGAKSILSFFI